ncbi:MAG: FAD-dependent oxidoreductase, partial [Thermodesulfobacteriota bacterium]|nr:FAD-dependent oxidoreductase [Thermodesulfobacteriota bacterium]
MANKYDVVVVGGGTSGLEAAKTLAQNGLKVALLERKTHPAKLYRACAQMFLMNMDSFYNEHMYFSKEQKKWIFPVNNFTVNYKGDYREFYALHFIAPNANDRIEVGDYEANQSGQGTPAVVFDKGALLTGLFEEGQQAGVEYFLERNVVDIRKIPEGVEIRTRRGDVFTVTVCIAADGVNSRLGRILGINRDRIFLHTSSAVSYYVTGVEFDRSEMICLGLSHDQGGLGTVQFCLLPSVYRDDEYWLYVVGQERFDYLINKSPFKKWFNNVEVTHKRCAITSNWSPAKEPYKDNVVFVGDSVWFAEAENSGALLSGHKAANAVCKALHTGSINREGVIDYINWWKQNWPETHDYKEFLCYPVFNRIFSEDEHNYLHKIVTQKLPWTLNPFKLYERLMQGIKPHLDKIKEERPALAQKIAMFRPEVTPILMKRAARAGYPP